MDIGPISSIRPVLPVRPSPPGSDARPDLAGVFAAEFRDQQRDDAYSPSRKASRGLEDEDSEEEAADLQSAGERRNASEDSSISFFA
jgi:hypothetical protein